MLSDATPQKAYWQVPGRPAGYAAVGDWPHLTAVGAGWPFVPNAADAYGQIPSSGVQGVARGPSPKP